VVVFLEAAAEMSSLKRKAKNLRSKRERKRKKAT